MCALNKRGQFICPICNEPVRLEIAKTDEDGHTIHEECYFARISGKIPPKPKRSSRAVKRRARSGESLADGAA